MADILIRMEMPHNCFECPLFSNCDACEGHECGCGLLGGIGYEEDISKDLRRDDCPLHELPEHGDLIDRDDLPLPAPIEDEYKRVREIIRNAPVIVPSNEENVE
jgi:hypothetical protein